jgi:hypothetical protein
MEGSVCLVALVSAVLLVGQVNDAKLPSVDLPIIVALENAPIQITSAIAQEPGSRVPIVPLPSAILPVKTMEDARRQTRVIVLGFLGKRNIANSRNVPRSVSEDSVRHQTPAIALDQATPVPSAKQ